MMKSGAVTHARLLTDRRRLLTAAAGLAAAPWLGAASPPAPVLGRVLAMSDLHSAYERTGQLLAALAAEVAARKVPHVIAIDGDIFEHGNVAAVRSNGEIDWAFLAALPKIAPTVVNLGNHDNDITTDLAAVVARLRELGLAVVSNIVDARTGAPYAPARADLPLGKRTLRVVGIGTNSIHTYPAASRPDLQIPVPGDWARAHLAQALAGADLALVLSHAGVGPDSEILPLLPDRTLMIGGHNHLQFQHRQGRSVYAHTGSWSNAYTAVTLRAAGPEDAVSVPVALDGPVAPALADLIPAVLGRVLSDDDRALLGTAPAALSLGDTGRAVAAAMARAAGAEAGFIGHTTLGTGLPAGPVSRYAFDAVVRFEGKLMVAEVSRERLAGFMARANQDRPMAFADRKGDFLYAAQVAAPAGDVVRVATTDWNATNQGEYFAAKDLAFREIEGLRLKAVAAQALLGTPA